MTSQAVVGRYILLVVYGPDARTILPPQQFKQLYQSKENLEANLISGIMSKFFYDLQRVISEDSVLIHTDADSANKYFLFQKIK